MAEHPLIDQLSDEALVTRWIESRRQGRGDVRWFNALYHRHRRAVRGRLAAVLGARRALLDELDQETWVSVMQLTEWRPGSFKAFVLLAATRKALTRLERHDVARHADGGAPGGDGRDEGPTPLDLQRAAGPAPDQSLEARRLVALVLAIVAGLPEERRDVWLLKYVEQCSPGEIQARLGFTEGMVKNHLRHAQADVAAALRARGLDPDDLATARLEEAT